MGLIRKTFALTAAASGVPVVRMNSKKQRVAKAQLGELRKQTAVMQQQVAAPPAGAPTQPVNTLPAAGWYLDPDRGHLLRWWDGTDWTERTAPCS